MFIQSIISYANSTSVPIKSVPLLHPYCGNVTGQTPHKRVFKYAFTDPQTTRIVMLGVRMGICVI